MKRIAILTSDPHEDTPSP